MSAQTSGRAPRTKRLAGREGDQCDPTSPWTVAYENLPPAPASIQFPEPKRTKVSGNDADDQVILGVDDARQLLKHLSRTCPKFRRWMERAQWGEGPPITEPYVQLEKWLDMFKEREVERLTNATNWSNFFAWFQAHFKPPLDEGDNFRAKKAYEWMMEQTTRTCTDPAIPDLAFPSPELILRNYDKWESVYHALRYHSL